MHRDATSFVSPYETKAAVEALLVRVHLYRGNYGDAFSHAENKNKGGLFLLGMREGLD
jgi:hypothetical protein